MSKVFGARGRFAALAVLLAVSVLVAIPVTATAGSTDVPFDDMEHGDPFGNGWFSFGGSVGGGGIGPNAADLPPDTTGAFSLETGWGSGGTPGFFGGFGRTNPSDLSEALYFNFWINPDSGVDATLEINLQDDDNADDGISSPEDDEFQFNCVVSAAGPCAVSGGGWQFVSIPLADFFDDNSFLTGGNGVLDAVPSAAGGNGQLVNVVWAVISNSGADVTFRTDDWGFDSIVIDDFEAGLPVGTDGDGNTVGFFTFSDGSPVSITTSTTPPAPVPISLPGNTVLKMDADVTAFAGFIHAFENATADTWVTQDWSDRQGFSFWLYGTNSGTPLFVDLLENRNPGSTTDDAERWTVTFVDDFTGWKFFQFPFSDFVRKEIGNGAPNDGLTLFEVHGWAFGTLTTGGPATFWMDDVSLYGRGVVPDLQANYAAGIFEITEGTTGAVTVRLNRPMLEDDPAAVTVGYTTEPGTAEPGRDYTPTSGTLTFTNGGAQEQTFSLETFGDDKFLGNKRVVLRLTTPIQVDTELPAGNFCNAGNGVTPVAILTTDDFDATTIDHTTVTFGGASETHVDKKTGEARRHLEDYDNDGDIDIVFHFRFAETGYGCDTVETVLVGATFDGQAITSTVPADLGAGFQSSAIIVDDDPFDPKLLDDFERGAYLWETTGDATLATPEIAAGDPLELPGQGRFEHVLEVGSGGSGSLHRHFPLPQDWTRDEALRFWFLGTGSGDEIGVMLKDNGAPDPGPAGWEMVWSDEFDEAAGTLPNVANWTHEIGDVTPDGKNGWGNNELQYYTDDPANAAHDGAGNLVITLREADGSLECYYGPCEYTSARLLSWHKTEFAYGRVESRLKVPGDFEGEDLRGLWPAFWSLGTDIDRNPWPLAGEIDFMEWVGRIPNEIFGTIHGPGYSGGGSFGNTFDFGEGVFNDYHTFTVEWEPGEIRWYVDGNLYHTATPADVAPNPWVFDKPFFMLLNFAIGGNFGGEVGDDVTFPQEYLLDYVRLWSAPDTAERFEASFVDDFVGWQQVTVPLSSFTRSAEQPAGAPDDGLGLEEVNGYGFTLPDGGTTSGTMLLDQVRLVPAPPPTTFVVTNLDDASKGSLRDGVGYVADGGTITFDPSLAGGTIDLTTGPIVLSRDVTIDGADALGITVDGGGADRVLIVDAGTTASVADLAMTNGFGFQLGGCVLNNGALTLDHVTVSGCVMTTDAPDFWQGGAGIYSGDGASLDLVDSTVANNSSGHDGGGVMSFFNTTTNVVRSTISGNLATNVGGGLRLLGNAAIDNSTISGNTSAAWHGAALFLTDGVLDVDHTTITANTAAAGTAAVFVGTFGPSSATMNVGNSIIAGNADFGCFLAPFGAGAVAINSLGGNVFTDASCNPVGSDQVVGDALLGPLADNGGPTLTHALAAGSPAIDALPAAGCPATDQRGVTRPQGPGCDVGSFERQP